MNEKHSHPPPGGLSLGDIYYVLFRHKWKILAISSVGLAAAIALPFIMPTAYQSEAKLFVRYVLESKAPASVGDSQARVKSPDDRGGENVLNSELEILTSLDLAEEVANSMTPEKILAKAGGGKDLNMATAIVHKNLVAEVPKKSNVIRLTFQHPDPEVVRPVLARLIDFYLARHVEIHREIGGFNDILRSETAQLKKDLNKTSDDLRKARTNAGVISLDDSRKAYTEQIAKIRQAIFDAEAELAERRAIIGQVEDAAQSKSSGTSNTTDTGSPGPVVATTPAGALTSATNQPTRAAGAGDQLATAIQLASALESAGTNAIPTSGSKPAGGTAPVPGNAIPTNQAPSPDQVAEYKGLTTQLDNLEKIKQQRLLEFTPENSMVKSIQDQITTHQKRKQELETTYPALLALKASETKTGADSASALRNEAADATRIAALQSKIKVLNSQLTLLRKEVSAMDDMEGQITDLQRTKELQESQYKYFYANLEQARWDEALGPGRVSNISKIEAPTPPARAASKLYQLMALAFLGSIGAAFGLAFVLEFYLDRSIKRAAEIEGKIGAPLFLTIPQMHRNGRAGLLKGKRVPLLTEKAGETAARRARAPASSDASTKPDVPADEPVSTPAPADLSIVMPVPADGSPAPWDDHHALHPFWDALRDRLITYFELKNLTHKPKLVALTSCASGSGVSTIASGLAASLSETGEGNVLLVEMNSEQGAAHQFFKGKPTCGLDEALELGKRDDALVQENLYVVKEATNGDKLPRVLPKRFNALIPRLKASDYDYIIFDMPPVSQISVTHRLARFMDMVLMVVESEKTDRDVVKRATSWLTETKANVGIVLNKSQTYVPKRLQQEL